MTDLQHVRGGGDSVAAGDWAATTTRARRQDGQVVLERSHASTQAVWKPCPQCGSTRTSSPRVNSAKQMAHSGRSAPSSSTSLLGSGCHDTVGSDSSAFFFIPLHGALAIAPGTYSTEKAEGLHMREQRATMANPTTQSRKQSTAARMSSVSVCTLVPPPATGRAAIAARRSTDCCISAFFLIPLHGAATAPGASTEKAEGLHRREHRATMASPTTQSRKQSTAARMSSVSVCTLVPPRAMAAAGGAASAARRSTDCCSRWRGIFLVGSLWDKMR
uniref:Uncharacterized protein n=1 Tax=Aegilops tauschii TaxID=37682 RepID=R7WBX7_AEGTA